MTSIRCKIQITMIFLTMIFIASLWLIDVSVSSMLNNGVVEGITGIHNPVTTYHIGLILATLSCFLFVGLYIIDKEK